MQTTIARPRLTSHLAKEPDMLRLLLGVFGVDTATHSLGDVDRKRVETFLGGDGDALTEAEWAVVVRDITKH